MGDGGKAGQPRPPTAHARARVCVWCACVYVRGGARCAHLRPVRVQVQMGLPMPMELAEEGLEADEAFTHGCTARNPYSGVPGLRRAAGL